MIPPSRALLKSASGGSAKEFLKKLPITRKFLGNLGFTNPDDLTDTLAGVIGGLLPGIVKARATDAALEKIDQWINKNHTGDLVNIVEDLVGFFV